MQTVLTNARLILEDEIVTGTIAFENGVITAVDQGLSALPGAVERLGTGGRPGLLDLPRVAEELHRTARVLRVFTFERREVSAERVLDKISRPVGS